MKFGGSGPKVRPSSEPVDGWCRLGSISARGEAIRNVEGVGSGMESVEAVVEDGLVKVTWNKEEIVEKCDGYVWKKGRWRKILYQVGK